MVLAFECVHIIPFYDIIIALLTGPLQKADLPILCERFTTSKISKFSDLQSIATYGFRGEALASISFVSHLTVVTKIKDENHAWKITYADGVPVPAKAGKSSDPTPCAGNDGTMLSVSISVAYVTRIQDAECLQRTGRRSLL